MVGLWRRRRTLPLHSPTSSGFPGGRPTDSGGITPLRLIDHADGRPG